MQTNFIRELILEEIKSIEWFPIFTALAWIVATGSNTQGGKNPKGKFADFQVWRNRGKIVGVITVTKHGMGYTMIYNEKYTMRVTHQPVCKLFPHLWLTLQTCIRRTKQKSPLKIK